MAGGEQPPPDEISSGRLQALSDSIFAFALTLLGSGLQVPETAGDVTAAALARGLGAQWQSYAALVLSFVTVVIMWLNHHAIFGMVRESDAPFLVANGLVLLLVAVVPLPTDLVTEFLGTPAAPMAVAVYAGFFCAVTLAYNPLWLAASHRGRLLDPAAPPAYARTLTRNYLIGLPLYLAATLMAFWNAYAGLGICLLLWVFWAMTARGRPRVKHSPAGTP